MSYDDMIDLSEVPELEEALDMFTSKRGREITRWTQNGLAERIEVINDKGFISVVPFVMCWHSIYEDASEALHGTMYGYTFRTSAYEPGIEHTDESKVSDNLRRHLTLLNWECGILLDTLMHAANHEGRLDELCDISAQNTKQTFEAMKKHLGGSPRSEDRESL